MTYEEAETKAMTVEWKTERCNQPKCWCRLVVPKDKIFIGDKEEYYLIGAGAVPEKLAEYIVALHNQSLAHDNSSIKPS